MQNAGPLVIFALLLAACSPAATPAPETDVAANSAPDPSATPVPATPTVEPSPTTPALLPLEIVEWHEYPYTNLADPNNTDTHVEVLIRNPNSVAVRIDRDTGELRFVTATGEIAYANPNPTYYIWQGEWMLAGETAALSACVCFMSSGLEPQEWESLELVMPLQEATNLSYTLDVEVTTGALIDIAEAHLGGSGYGIELTLANNSEHVLESIPMRIHVYAEDGSFLGVIGYGNAVVSFTEDIGIQPGDTGTGIDIVEIEYYDATRMTFEAHAIGLIK